MTELFPEPLRHELTRSQMDRILLWCVEKRASDIVFCPGDPVWMEQDGVWRRVTDAGLTPSETERIVNETTMQASRAGYVRSGRSTDYAYQTRVPESRGVWQRFRVNATSTSKGIYIVMRALPRAIPTLGGMEGISDSLRRALYPASGLVCVSGVMGSGKSTLMRGLLGLIQPQSGTIEHAPALKHGAIGYLPQQTRAQRDFPATVLEVVLSGCRNRQGLHCFYTPAQRTEAMMNLGKLGILELKDACYRDLSGGQQQRVLLARALCAASQLLILDEPITGLDPAAAQDLYKTLAYLNQKEGMAIVMVTHDLKAALKSVRTVLHIGRKGLFSGTVADYLASPQGRRFREELES